MIGAALGLLAVTWSVPGGAAKLAGELSWFFNGLVGVAIELNNVGAGDGGFACV